MGKEPIYITSDPEEYAAKYKERLLSVGCCEEYAETTRLDILERAVQVSDSWEANAILSGRVARKQ